jgi:signal transduction histidine kinase
VDCAATGREALERLEACPPDLIVLDYRLPDTDGIELMKTILARGVRAPIIFVTTAESVQLAVEAMRLGAEDFVQKQEGYLEVLPLIVREALERQRLRREHSHLESELRQAEKLASVGVLAAGLAHNINNRLTSLKTFFELMPFKYNDAGFRGEFAKTCASDLDKVTLLIQELTRYAFSDPKGFLPQSMGELLARAAEHVDDLAAQKRVRVDIDVRDVPDAPLEPESVKQLFINLMKNAIQASPEGAPISVTVEVERSDPPTALATVRDRGPGIAEALRERVFDPFFTTKHERLGLGLFVCHRIVTIHRGRIDIDNHPDGGAVISVRLPLRPLAEAPPTG